MPSRSGKRPSHVRLMLAPIAIGATLIFCFPGSAAVASRPAGNQESPKEFRSGEVLVRLQGRDRVLRVRLPNGVAVEDAVTQFGHEPSIEHAEGNALYRATAIEPPDPRYADAWHLRKVNAPEAWERTVGSPEVTIAVLDTGVDMDHPDLSDNMWRNPDEIYDGRDNDGNGYIDDLNGWNFVEGTADSNPVFSPGATKIGVNHGTVVAGIAAAKGGNGVGTAGVAWRVKIMPLRVLASDGTGDTLAVVRAIDYATNKGADVINMSFVGFDASLFLTQAIERAYRSGVVIVAAAGNESANGFGTDLDSLPVYPACHNGPSGENWIIGVASSDQGDRKTNFSNYGSCVDIVAPGENVPSITVYEPSRSDFSDPAAGLWSGTSVSAPIVAGAAALIRSIRPHATPAEVIDALRQGAAPIDAVNTSFAGKLGAGRLDLLAALRAAEAGKPRAIVTAAGSGSLPLVRSYENSGTRIVELFAYAPGFRGGVSVAAGDIDGDGKDEIITGAGKGGGPHVRVWDANGTHQFGFFAYAPSFRGGVSVAAGDIDGDGKDEIITGAGKDGSPEVRIFRSNGQLVKSFLAYAPGFRGGIDVAVGDIDGDGTDEIVTAPGRGGGPHVRAFRGDGSVLQSFFAYDASVRAGVVVALGDLNGDGKDEIITGLQTGAPSEVRTFSGPGTLGAVFTAFPGSFGVRLAADDLDGDGRAEIVASYDTGGNSEVRSFTSFGALVTLWQAFPDSFRGGVDLAIIRR
ncbi:MAG: S8 family serine peptidase [Patescibacteria group bacterium]